MNSTKKITFNHSYKSLGIWFLCTYMVFGPLLSLLRNFKFSGNIIEFIGQYLPFGSIFQMNSLLSYFLFMCFSYMAFYMYYPKHKLLLSLGLVLSLFVPIAIRFFIDQVLVFWITGNTNYLPGTTFKFYFSDNTYFAVYYIPSGIIYYFYRRNKALQKAQLEAERLRLEAELTHLRSQINPHFLFNSLNNIYSLAYDKSDKILGAIEGLSSLLRYALYEKSEYVTFSKEWEKAQQLIEIEQMRLLNSVDFNIQIEEGVSDFLIPPVILLPIIENVFKHGEVQNEKHPPSIRAYSENETFIVSITNKLSPTNQKDHHHGIGLENIKKRLEHAFGSEATFEITKKDDTFRAQLSIPIQ